MLMVFFKNCIKPKQYVIIIYANREIWMFNETSGQGLGDSVWLERYRFLFINY